MGGWGLIGCSRQASELFLGGRVALLWVRFDWNRTDVVRGGMVSLV